MAVGSISLLEGREYISSTGSPPSVKALFLEHEGYCGAVGAMLSVLKNIDFNVIPNTTIDDDDKNSVDVDPTLYVEDIVDFVWTQNEENLL